MNPPNYSKNETGISGVYIWIGPKPPQHWYRIKISNKNSFFDKNDCFVLTIPDFDIIGDNKIDNKKLKLIKEFIKLNLKSIMDYEDEKILTDEFEELIIKVDINENYQEFQL